MRLRARSSVVVILVVLALVLGFGAGIGVARLLLPGFALQTLPASAQSGFGLMAEAWETIQQYYVDRASVQPQQLTYGAISGMTDALGDTGHSRFLSPDMVQEEHNLTQGQFQGVGIEVQLKDGHVVIVAPIDNSPAQRAGLHAGDIILRVDGKSIVGLPLSQVSGLILGPAGTSVTLTIMDPQTTRTRDVSLVRATIKLQNVTWQQLPGTTVAHLRIAAFSQGITADVKQALEEIQRQNLTGLILDLRNNPGGLLDEAVGTASQFLQGGNVLLEKDAQGRLKGVAVVSGGVAPGLPMVVLINGGTASASEVVAGALQDARRAPLVGETTFGTGTVLSEFPLADGSELLLATLEWLTPLGRAIWHQGISPTVAITLSPGVTPLVPEAERNMSAAELQASDDKQLLAGLTLLQRSVGPAAGQPMALSGGPTQGWQCAATPLASGRIVAARRLIGSAVPTEPGSLSVTFRRGCGTEPGPGPRVNL